MFPPQLKSRVLYCFSVMAVGELVVTSDPWVDLHQSTTVTCSVVMAQALDLNWQKGPLGGPRDATRAIVFYDTTSSDRVIWNSTVDRTHFIFDETRDDFPLTIISVTLEDEGRYWCKVTDDVTFLLSSKHTDTRIRGKTAHFSLYFGLHRSNVLDTIINYSK